MSRCNHPATLLLAILATLALGGCGEYQAIMRTQDSELWFTKGLEYYQRGDYKKSCNLLGNVLAKYAGTSKYDTLLTTYAHSLAYSGDFYSAAHYFSDYVKTYPSSHKCEECQYMAGYCYYMLSPRSELDQSDTESAIEELNYYLQMYPQSSRAAEAERMLHDMEDKLALKAFNSAKLYYNMGNYMGNNYNSAVITAQNCLRKYPDTVHREELSYLILRAKYIQADRSILLKQADRYRDTIDEYYSFVNDYPTSKWRGEADKILERSERGLKHAEKLLPPSQDDLDYYMNFGQRHDQQRDAKQDIND